MDLLKEINQIRNELAVCNEVQVSDAMRRAVYHADYEIKHGKKRKKGGDKTSKS